MSKTLSSNGSNSDGLGARVASDIVRRLKEGESPEEVRLALNVGYMCVYKIAIGKTWKSLTGGKRLIAERKPRIRKKHREFVAIAKSRNKTNASIARKLKVTETTVARLVADNKLILAHRLRSAVLTSGSEDAAARAVGIKPREVPDLLLLAAEPLPRRLRDFVEE